MINPIHKLSMVKVFVFTLVAVFGMTTLATADPKQKNKHGKKKDVFVNGHDARDGRNDGRGRNRDRRRDDDGNEDHDRNNSQSRRNRSDRDNDGINDRTEIKNQAFNVGYDEGLRAGQDDRARNRRSNLNDFDVYRAADKGYRDSYNVERRFFQTNFRQGFREGHNDGLKDNRDPRYGSTGRYGGRIGDILGDILGGRLQ